MFWQVYVDDLVCFLTVCCIKRWSVVSNQISELLTYVSGHRWVLGTDAEESNALTKMTLAWCDRHDHGGFDDVTYTPSHLPRACKACRHDLKVANQGFLFWSQTKYS